MKLTCWGGVGAVTGANFLMEGSGGSFLIDCGLRQGDRFGEAENYEAFPYDTSKVNALIITHAHMDHIGRIPKLVRDGFRGVIYSTRETHRLTEIMFGDALSLLTREAKAHGIAPLYEKNDVDRALTLWQEVPYHSERELLPGVTFYLKDAGHILGSSMVEVRSNGTKMLFTGDLGNSPSLLLNDTESPEGADYVLMESVYGDRNHETHEERDTHFAEILKETIARGGTAVVPAFSLERTQNILYSLNNLIEEGKLASVPVFVDSPLAIKVTEIYRAEQKNFNADIKKEIAGGDDIFNFPKLQFTVTTHESDAIEKTQGPKIILAGSGMSAGGRVTKHEKAYIGDPKNTILLVGYQSVGTLGRKIQDGARTLVIDNETITVRAHIENVQGFSSHKDSDHLVEFIGECVETVKKVFVVMGEPKSSLVLVQKLRDNLDVDALFPEKGIQYDLEF